MQLFILRRVVFGVLTILGASIVVFGLSRMTGDPRYLYAQPGGYGMTEEQWAALGRELYLDRPLVVQYFLWLGDALRGDLGKSLFDRKPVIERLMDTYPNTLKLALAAFILSVVGGIPLGVLAAVKRGSVFDYIGRGIALFGQAVPVFWLGL
ncbi:MAG: ABC transporter permease, partial [Chloroflexota bacterium]|nr:ABC transporter permease [Chloroflexota bacterium]